MMSATEASAGEHVVQLLDADGSATEESHLGDGPIVIGRTGAGISCPDDAGMEDRHAEIQRAEDGVVVIDSGVGSGVWLRVEGSQGRLLRSGDQIWLGSQILVLRSDASGWRIRHHGPDGLLRQTHALPDSGLFVGRASDLVLDLEDTRLSRRHAQLVLEGDGIRLYDRGAHNGTFIKVTTRASLSNGDEFRIAANRFRYVVRATIESGAAEVEPSPSWQAETLIYGSEPSSGVESTAPAGQEPDAHSAAPTSKPRKSRGLAARLRKLGPRLEDSPDSPDDRDVPGSSEASVQASGSESPREKVLAVLDTDAGSISIEVRVGQTVLEAVQAAGLERGDPVDWECEDGGCGVCVLGVVEGAERMDPPDPATGEMKTIQITEQVVPDPKKYRLACLARVRGTVRLRKLT